MALKHIKTFSEFQLLTEVAKWDDPEKKKIDAFFVSFDKDEMYEPEYLLKSLILILKGHGINASVDSVWSAILKCKEQVAHNHPRKGMIKCILSNFDIEIEDIEK